jgi:hypothetical protein
VTTPPVTVLVPAFNAEATLAETLQSVLGQSHEDWRCIIVDDGSSDGTGAVAASFCARDPRFELVRQPNRGVAAARNVALRRATGTFVAPLDADDVWHEDYLKRQLETATAAQPAPGLVFCYSRRIDAASRVLRTVAVPTIEGSIGLPHFLATNLVGNGSAILAPRAAMLEAGGYDESLRAAGCEGAEDYLLQMRIAARHAVAVTPLYLVGYRMRHGSMGADTETMMRSVERSIETILAEAGPDSSPAAALARHRASSALQLAAARARRGDVPATVALLATAWRLDPLRSALVTARLGLRTLLAPIRRRLRPAPAFGALAPTDPADAPIAGLRSLVHKLDSARLSRIVEQRKTRPMDGDRLDGLAAPVRP